MEFKSITKSSYLEEGLEALRIAKNVETVKELEKKFIINQNSVYSRKTCRHEVLKRYFTIENKKISRTPLLKLIDFIDEKLNRELMYYNYLHKEPIAGETVLKYLYPGLISEEISRIEKKSLVLFLNEYIDKYSDTTINKTAISIRKALLDFGIARVEDGEIVYQYYNTSLYSFLYGLYAEYSPGDETAKRFNILNPSLDHIRGKAYFYKLFFIKPSLLRTYLNLGWEKGYLDIIL